jgi:cytochrome c oxidase subunit 3
MPSLLTNSSAETLEEQRQRERVGGGGLPPVEKPPTGGGGDGDEEWNEEHHGPRSKLKMIRLLVLFAFFGDLSAYITLILAFFVRQKSFHLDAQSQLIMSDWHRLELPPILFLNSAALLISALTMEVARRKIFREIDVMDEWLGLGKPALKRTLPWLGATLGLGLFFLAGQLEAWRQLVARRITFGRLATPASNFFYILTGFHLLHLLVGLLAIGIGVFLLPRLKRVELRQIAVDSTAWFWMATCAMWMILFALLLFGQ